MTALRSQRSMSAPAGRLKSRYGRSRIAVSSPASAGEWVSTSTSNGRASVDMFVPSTEIVWPLQSRRKSRLRHKGRGGLSFTVPPLRMSLLLLNLYTLLGKVKLSTQSQENSLG